MKRPHELTPEICNGKRFFVRADCNIPLYEENIQHHDFRLKSILPTIDFILNNGGKIILGTHLGKPKALERTNYFDEKLSTKQLIPWFKEKRYNITYEIDLMKAIDRSQGSFDQILLLENLRFFNGEHEHNFEFAQLLRKCADFYVNDAFGMIHRNDTSVTLLPEQFSVEQRFWGKLMKKECIFLDNLKRNLPHPFTCIIGGKKVSNKLTWLLQLIDTQENCRPKTILTGGLTALAFLQAENHLEASSEISTHQIKLAQSIINLCQQYNITLIIPKDFVVLDNQENGNTSIVSNFCDINSRPIVDIGPSTIQTYINIINQSKLVITAGTMGRYEHHNSAEGSKKILCSLNRETTIVGGGDTVAALISFECHNAISFLSTGGGSLLAYFASSDPYKELPGLAHLTR